MSNDRTFCYHREVKGILDFARHTIFQGGPGMGKTAVLSELYRQLCAEKRPATLLAWGNEAARTGLRAWLKNPTGALLIDNLDHSYDREIEDELRSRLPLVQAHDDRMMVVTMAVPASSRDMVAAQRNAGARTRLSNPVIDSVALAQFEREWLNPWKYGWGNNWCRRFQEHLAEELKNASLTASAEKLEQVAKGTGGHPWFMEKATISLLRALRWRAANKDVDEDSGDIVEEIGSQLDDVATAQIHRSVEWARMMIGDEGVRAFLDAVPPAGTLATRVDFEADLRLEWAGLVRRVDDAHEIPCEALRRALEVHAAAMPRRRSPRTRERSGPIPATNAPPSVKLRPPRGRLGGQIEWERKGEPISIHVPPSEWKVLHLLERRAGDAVHVNDLMEQLHLSRAAITSRLQRLRDRLDDAGLHNLVENIHSQGYRYTAESK